MVDVWVHGRLLFLNEGNGRERNRKEYCTHQSRMHEHEFKLLNSLIFLEIMEVHLFSYTHDLKVYTEWCWNILVLLAQRKVLLMGIEPQLDDSRCSYFKIFYMS